jgi:PAB-dependent poly(A)-specific ribonuclease subunit 2
MSFYGTELSRYTSFKAYSTHGDVRQILVNEKGVIALGPRDIHMALRRGPPLWHIQCVPDLPRADSMRTPNTGM